MKLNHKSGSLCHFLAQTKTGENSISSVPSCFVFLFRRLQLKFFSIGMRIYFIIPLQILRSLLLLLFPESQRRHHPALRSDPAPHHPDPLPDSAL